LNEISIIEEKLPLSQKINYSLANVSLNTLNGIIGTGITFFYITILGLDPLRAGNVWLIFGIWNAINDPLIGVIQDRTKGGRNGRRMPYLRYGSFVYAALFILCWYPIGDIGNQTVLFYNLLLALCAFDTLFTMLGCIIYPLPAEIAIKSSNRSTLMVWSNIIGGLFGFITSVLTSVLLIDSGADSLNSLHPWFRPIMIIIGVSMGLLMFITSFYLKENLYTTDEEPLSFFKSFIETFKNSPFLVYEIGVFLILIAQSMLTTGMLFYMKDVLQISGILVTIPYIILALSQVAFSLVVNKMIKKYGLKKNLILGAIWLIFSLFLMFWIGWWYMGALVGLLLASFGISAISLTSSPMFADIVDYDEILTGKRRETSYSGIQAFLTKFSISIGTWLFLLIIDSYGYISNKIFDQFPQPQPAQFGIMLAMFVIPAIIALFTLLIMRFYKLDGLEWEKEKAKLAEVHLRKEIEFLQKQKQKTK
jgi:GPH family glycoside/pentoside/hexuronide:cation symporter